MPNAETPAEKGVYYSAQDRIGIGGRFLIIVVDLSIVIAAGIACIALSRKFDPGTAFLAWLIFAVTYLIVLKATPIRTLGYRLCNAKLVDMNGVTPNVLRIMCRLLLTQIGVCNPILDPFWFRLGRKRTLRDLMMGTYVVKNGAQPTGRAEIIYRQLFILSYSFMYREVKEPAESL